MNEKLQQAIVATRTGQKREAQRLLTEVLKEDPENAQAWFLLSHLVDSKEKQVAYLGKALALDPQHQKAKQRLARLRAVHLTATREVEEAPVVEKEVEQRPEMRPVSAGPLDLISQERGDTLPDWLSDDATFLDMDQAAAQAEPEDSLPATAVQLDVPDWLQEVTAEGWEESKSPDKTEAEPAIEKVKEKMATGSKAPAVKPSPAKSLPATGTARHDREAFMTRMLIGLIVVAIFVFLGLLYVIFTTF